jgi:D,D-heptose 1,7-bisphosphate phosphatase
MKNKAVFLDRDGTIIVDKDYTHKISDLEFYSDSFSALKKIQKKGYKMIIITNQSGIGRGYFSTQDYLSFMTFFHEKLKKEGITITGEYYCKHLPEDKCSCRKPHTDLIKKAIKEHNIDVSSSFFIGDKTSDIEAGKRVECKTILVMTGKSGKDKEYEVMPDFTCKNLAEASLII